jgi:GWxTD domain-containing protein
MHTNNDAVIYPCLTATKIYRTIMRSRLIATLIVASLLVAAIPSWCEVSLFSVDAAAYKMPEDWAFLEVYTLTPRKNLRYELTVRGQDTSFEASMELVCSILSDETLLASDTLDAIDTTPDTNLITSSQSLPHVFVFQIRAGTYNLKCQMIDRKRGLGDVAEEVLVVPDFPDDELAMSDIQLAISIEREDKESRFHKNGYRVYPNPQNIYGESLPRLNYYAEVYNLNYQGGVSGKYCVESEVLDADKNPVRSYNRTVKPIAGPSMVEVGGFPVTGLKSGTYYLKLTATDSTNNRKTARFKKFFVLHPSEIAERAVMESDGSLRITFPTDYATLEETEIGQALEDIRYLLIPEEERRLKKLNLEGKRAFLSQFWAARDPDPSTPENERRTEHYRRLGEANYMFGFLDVEGWKTDRGRIWVKWGRPDSEESYPMEMDARAYKIWYYDQLEGGVEFVLVDRNGFGNYELVHSTLKGEVYNSNWYEMEVQGYRTRERGRSFQPGPDENVFWRE